MSKSEAVRRIRQMGLVARLRDGEIRIALPIRNNEASACYTDDADDAIGTAMSMVNAFRKELGV